MVLGKSSIATSFDLLIYDWKKGDSLEAFEEFKERFNNADHTQQSRMLKELRMKNRDALMEYLKYEKDPKSYR